MSSDDPSNEEPLPAPQGVAPLAYHEPSLSPYDRPVPPAMLANARRVRRIIYAAMCLIILIIIAIAAICSRDGWGNALHRVTKR